MKIAVVGSRTFTNQEFAFSTLDKYIGRDRGHSVVSGGARGVDTLAEKWAKNRGIPVQVIPAEWERYGRSAGFRRNGEIVNRCDGMVAFWDGQVTVPKIRSEKPRPKVNGSWSSGYSLIRRRI